jgi:hypothetical protein
VEVAKVARYDPVWVEAMAFALIVVVGRERPRVRNDQLTQDDPAYVFLLEASQ